MEQGDSYKACLRCGKLVPAGTRFCTSCGADLTAAPAPGQQGAVDPAEFEGMGGVAASPEPQVTAAGATKPPEAMPVPPPPPYGVPLISPQPYIAQPPAQPVYAYPTLYQPKKTDEMAIASLVCAVASFVILPFLPAIAAIALGFVARDRIRKSTEPLEGNGMAIAGILVGIANLVLWAGLIAIMIIVHLY